MRKRESVELNEPQWGAVAGVAEVLGCKSWRVMLRRIASGELIVVHKPNALPAGVVAEIPAQATRAKVIRAASILTNNERPNGPRAMESLAGACAAGSLASRRAGAAPVSRPFQTVTKGKP